MFKNDYKNDIENIKPDGFIKYKILKKLKEPKMAKKSPKHIYWIGAVAAVLCITMTLSLIGIIRRNAPKISDNQTFLMKSENDYNGIYKTLKKFRSAFSDHSVDLYAGGNAINSIKESASDQGTNSSNTLSKDYSETTTQVEGVDEADIIKTDGNYIYILSYANQNRVIKIIDVREKVPKQLSSIFLDNENQHEMYLNGDRLIVIGTNYDTDTVSFATIFDISNPNEPKQLQICSQSGEYNTSRLIGNKLYMISNLYINVNGMEKNNSKSYVPSIEAKNYSNTISADCIYLYDECINPEYTVVSAFDIKDGTMLSTQSVLGGSYTVYASTENIITTSITNGQGKTQVARFELEGDNIKLAATGYLDGCLLNQFSIDENNNHFRFVLTDTVTLKQGEVTDNGDTRTKEVDVTTTGNSLVIMDENLKETGKITDLAPGERVYSARFIGDTAYFVTFRQVDPLFSVDVSDPKNPKILGALKIPGFSNYLFPFGDGKLLGIGQDADENTGKTNGLKLSMFDISNPSNVTESDKTIIDAYYSTALYNHKEILCDYSKNLISFTGNRLQTGKTLYVYSYENGKFNLRLAENFNMRDYNIRSLYIGDTFYIVADNEIRYFDLDTLQKLGNVYLN